MHAFSGGNSHVGTHVCLGGIAFGLDILLIHQLTPLLMNARLYDLLALAAIFCILLFFGLEFAYATALWSLLKSWDKYQFSGTYEECSASGQVTDVPATLKIWQHWNTIEINFKSCDGIFKSITAAIVKNRLERGDIELVFSFQSSGSHLGVEREGAYLGTFILKRSADDDTAEAIYFTESRLNNFRHLYMKRKPSYPA
ncbi:MAG: hypothetical protein P4L57_06625 [Rhizomicrobium sp.]|nr:hypothetical protein [Rhizomicrobium sp.]